MAPPWSCRVGRIEELRAAGERSLKSINSCSKHGGFCRAESGDEVPHAAKVGMADVPLLEMPIEVLGVHFVLLCFIFVPVGSPCMQPVTEMPECSSELPPAQLLPPL